MAIDSFQHIEAQAQTCVQDLSALHDMLSQVGQPTTNTDAAIAALQQAIANVHAYIGQLQAQGGGSAPGGAYPSGDPSELPPNPYDAQATGDYGSAPDWGEPAASETY